MGLPASHTSARLESLPKDLKAAAERLVRRKFGLAEEPEYMGEHMNRQHPALGGLNHQVWEALFGNGVRTHYAYDGNVRTRQHIWNQIHQYEHQHKTVMEYLDQSYGVSVSTQSYFEGQGLNSSGSYELGANYKNMF